LNAIPGLWHSPIDAIAVAAGALIASMVAVAIAAVSVTRQPVIGHPE